MYIHMLRCPYCRKEKDISFDNETTGYQLVCNECGRKYDIEHGVPVLLEKEYSHYVGHDPKYEENYKNATFHSPGELSNCLFNQFMTISEVNFAKIMLIKYQYDERLCKKIVAFFKTSAANKNILNVGSGLGTYDHILTREIHPPPNIFSVELVKHAAIKCQKQYAFDNIQYFCGDGNNLPFADNSFDFAYSKNAIEHAGPQMLGEISRTLKENGQAIIIGPSKYAEVFLHPLGLLKYLKTGKTHGISLKEYKNFITSAGLKIIRHDALSIRGFQKNNLFAHMPPVFLRTCFVFNAIIEKILNALNIKDLLWMQVFYVTK